MSSSRPSIASAATAPPRECPHRTKRLPSRKTAFLKSARTGALRPRARDAKPPCAASARRLRSPGRRVPASAARSRSALRTETSVTRSRASRVPAHATNTAPGASATKYRCRFEARATLTPRRLTAPLGKASRTRVTALRTSASPGPTARLSHSTAAVRMSRARSGVETRSSLASARFVRSASPASRHSRDARADGRFFRGIQPPDSGSRATAGRVPGSVSGARPEVSARALEVARAPGADRRPIPRGTTLGIERLFKVLTFFTRRFASF